MTTQACEETTMDAAASRDRSAPCCRSDAWRGWRGAERAHARSVLALAVSALQFVADKRARVVGGTMHTALAEIRSRTVAWLELLRSRSCMRFSAKEYNQEIIHLSVYIHPQLLVWRDAWTTIPDTRRAMMVRSIRDWVELSMAS
jgi:hypothetical protein